MRLIFKLVILGLIIFGLNYFGAFKYFATKNVDNTKRIERAQSIVDLSKMNNEYKINYVFKFLQYNLISISHVGANQKFYIVKCPKNRLFKEEDFKNGILERKLKEFNKNTETCFIHLENFKFTQKNIINTTSFKIPYAAFQTEVVNVPMYGRIKVIIGASNSLKDANLVFIAYNDSQKYSNILTNEFFKSIGTKIAK